MRPSYPNPSFSDLSLDEKSSPEDAKQHGPAMTKKANMPPPGRAMTRSQQFIMMAIILEGLFFSTVDTTIVSTALVQISADLGTDYTKAPWIILSYLLTYTGFAVCIAKLSDIYGRSALAIFSWICFTICSIGCGVAATQNQLIVFRALQGIGGSGLYSLAQATIMEIASPRYRGLVGTVISVILCLSFVAGPLLGGAFGRTNWRWIFYINIPAGIFAVPGWYMFWPGHRRTAGFKNALRKVDIFGSIAIAASSILFVWVTQQAGSLTSAWNSATSISGLVLSGVCFVAFWLWQFWLHKHPQLSIESVFPIRLASRYRFISALSTVFLTGFSYIALVINLAERFQIVEGDDPMSAGVHLLPMLFACAVGSFLSGGVASRRGCANIMLPIGTSIQILGTALLWKLTGGVNDMAAVFASSAVYGLGVGVVFAAATMTGSMESNGCMDLASAQGALAQARMLGGCIGLAMCSVIFNEHVHSQLSGLGLLHPLDMQAIYRNPLAVVDLPSNYQPLVRSIYLSAFDEQMLLMLCISILGFLVSLPAFSRKTYCMGQIVRQAQQKQLMSQSSGRSESIDSAMAAGSTVTHRQHDGEAMEIIDLGNQGGEERGTV